MKMKRTSLIQKFLIGALIVAAGLTYQNCAPTMQTDSASEEAVMQMSLDPTITNPNLPGHSGSVNGHQFILRKDQQVTTYGFQLMNKHQILSTLKFAFGPDVLNPSLSIEAYLQAYYAQFGGPCNLHEPVRYKDGSGKVTLEGSVTKDCNATTLSYTPALPALTSSREALMDKICARSVHSLPPVRYAIAQIDARNPITTSTYVSVDSDPASSAVSRNYGLYKAFRLFYPTQPDPRSNSPVLLESLRVMFANPAAPTINEWRNVLYTLCISPYWQVM